MTQYEVVISGISGAFAGELDVDGLEERMFNNDDDGIITLDSKDFVKDGHSDKAEFLGKVVAPLDGQSFGISGPIRKAMDASLKAVLEKTYEAIIDAGIPPSSLKGQNIASIGALFNNESEMQLLDNNSNKYSVLIINRGMMANRVSYTYDFTGMSFTIDCCWLGGLAALDMGARLVATGMAKAALVMNTNIILRPETGEQLGPDGLAFISPDGKTRCFSQNADGFARSEAVIAMFLQRKEDALRSYGKIEMSQFSSTMVQQMSSFIGTDSKTFLDECYSNITIDPEEIAYLEADGIAIPDKDRQELEAVIESIGSRRKSRLPVSCCKSRLGHSGGAAGLVSVVHSLLASRLGYIPPTLHYVPPSSLEHPANHPKIEIVTEKAVMNGNLLAVNVHGFSDISGHIVVRRNEKNRSAQDILDESDPPVLIQISGRNASEMSTVLKKLSKTCKDRGFIALTHKAFRMTNPTHTIRGFGILHTSLPTNPVVQFCDLGGKLPPVWLVFSGMGSQWNQMGRDLLKLPILAASLQHSHDILLTKGLDLLSILTSEDPNVFEDITNAFVANTAIQVALVDLLNRLGIKADGIIGHSAGEVACGYADGCLTAEQALLCAYARGRASKEAPLIKGMMAAIGRGYSDMKDYLPDEIEVACHNSSTSCTISGPTELVHNYVTELKNKGVFAKAVNVANIAYHSKYISPAGPLLLKYMKEIIVEPKERSSRWVCSSVEESRWEEATLCSAEYYTNNLLSAVLFEEASHHIPEGALLIEVAPHGLLQAILKRSHPTCQHVPLTSRTAPDNLVHLLEAIGRIFIHGLDMDLSSIYPEVSFPVPRETKSLCKLCTWLHDEDSFGTSLNIPKSSLKTVEEIVHIKSQEAVAICDNFVIQGKSVFPTTFILGKVRAIVQHCKLLQETDFVQFERVRIHSLLEMSRTNDTKVFITVLEEGEFLVFSEQRTLVMSGSCSQYYGKNAENFIKEGKEELKDLMLIEQNQIYHLLEKADYVIQAPFTNIKSIQLSPDGFIAEIALDDDYKYFMESVILSALFFEYFNRDQMCQLETIQHVIMQNVSSFKSITNIKDSVSVHYSVASGALTCDGLFISNLKFTKSGSLDAQVSFRKTTFFPSASTRIMSSSELVEPFTQVILQQASNKAKKICIIKLDDIENVPHAVINLISKYSQAEVEVKTVSLVNLGRLVENTEQKGISSVHVIPYVGNCVPDEIYSVCERSANNFVLLMADKSCTTDFNRFSCSLEVQLDNYTALVLNKPKKASVNKENIYSISDSFKKIQSITTPNYIVSNLKSYSWVMELYDNNSRTDHFGDIRFVFLDESSPSFDCDSAFYKEQLQKGLRINVCNRSQWGYMIQKQSEVTTTDNNNSVFIESALSNTVSVQSISANHLEDNNAYTQIVDYQGTLYNKRVLGIACLEDNELQVDPVLQWDCPSTWGSEQACTVPVAYSMAYYIASLSSRIQHKENILIVEPEGPFGDAIIRVFSFIGFEITIVYTSLRRKQIIMRRFPQINEVDVIVCENSKLLAELEKKACNGYRIIINSSEEPRTLSVLSKCSIDGNLKEIPSGAVFFQISKKPLEENYQLGLGIMNKGISLISCFPATLLSLKEEEKVEIKVAVEKGMKEGVVEPLQYKTIVTPVTHQQLQQAKQESKEKSENLIIHFKPKKEDAVNNPKKCAQLLIGKGELCYSLLHHLESESAKNIHALIDEESISPFFNNRYKSLRNKGWRKNTHFHAFSNLESINSSQTLITGIQKSHHIESAFILTEGMESTILEAVERGVMRELERECRVYLVGLDAIEARGTCVRLVTQNQSTARVVSALAKLYRNHVSEGEYHLSQTTNQYLDDCRDPAPCMPNDIHELLDYDYWLTSGPAYFTQIATRCTPVVSSSRYSPLFIIPGFRVAKLKAMVARLYCAAFMARLPSKVTDIDSLAIQLKKQLTENFRQEFYSFVCEGWAQLLTIKLAKLLEEEGKQCQIFMLDAEFKKMLNYMKGITASRLILDYLPVSNKIYAKLSKGQITEDNIELVLRDSELNNSDTWLRESCLRNIIDTSSMIRNAGLQKIKTSAYVTCIKPFGDKQLHQAPDIEEICNRPVWVSCVRKKDVFSCAELASVISDTLIQEIPGHVNKQNLDRQRKIAYFGRDLSEIKKVKSLI